MRVMFQAIVNHRIDGIKLIPEIVQIFELVMKGLDRSSGQEEWQSDSTST